MVEKIAFDEWGPPRILHLSVDEAAVITGHDRVFRCHHLGGRRYRVGPRGGFVGACTVSKGRQVFIRPKVPIESFYELLWLGHRLQPLPSLTTHALYEEGDASDWFAFLVLSEIEALIRGQLRNGYVEVSEPCAFLRGRVDFARPMLASAKSWCTYSNFQVDTPVNRIIRGALEVIANGPCRADVKYKAENLLYGLSSVSYIKPSLYELEALSLDVTHSAYVPVVELIRILFSGSGIKYSEGSVGASGLFLQMDRIFERAVYAALIDELGGPLVRYQPDLGSRVKYLSGAPNLGISMRPDVVTANRPTAVIAKTPEAAVCVIDAKYRRPIDAGRFKPGFNNANIYQIFTYASALQCRGILAYPRIEHEVHINYRLGDINFEIQTIDLGLPSLAGLRAFAGQFGSLKAA